MGRTVRFPGRGTPPSGEPMTRIALRFVVAMAFSAGMASAGSTNRITFAESGFSIAPLDAPPGRSPQQVLMMLLPATNGFAPNVNVQLQPYAGTLDEYALLSLGQFRKANLKVLHQAKTPDSALVFEYSGEMQGQNLHWYARIQKSGGMVYVATATALEEQWAEFAPRLKFCIDSFSCGGK